MFLPGAVRQGFSEPSRSRSDWRAAQAPPLSKLLRTLRRQRILSNLSSHALCSLSFELQSAAPHLLHYSRSLNVRYKRYLYSAYFIYITYWYILLTLFTTISLLRPEYLLVYRSGTVRWCRRPPLYSTYFIYIIYWYMLLTLFTTISLLRPEYLLVYRSGTVRWCHRQPPIGEPDLLCLLLIC